MGERYLDLIEKLVSNELLFIPKYTNLRCQQQRHHNFAKGEISPCEARLHPPKADFTLPKAASYARRGISLKIHWQLREIVVVVINFGERC